MNLADIYSFIDSKKRAVGGLLENPGATIDKYVAQFREDNRDRLNLQANAYPMAGDKTVMNSPHQLDQFRQQLADEGANMAMSAATVWHGSPHKFDKFDSSKIGTGEGAQAYGHGLYLAESPKVAEEYKKQLATKFNAAGLKFDGAANSHAGSTGNAELDDYLLSNLGNTSGARRDILDGIKYVRSGNPDGVKGMQQTLADLRKVRSQTSVENTGALYKVDLPDEHIAKMLDLDRTLSSQNPEVLRALGLSDELALDWTRGRQNQNLPAEANHFYSQLSETLGSPAKASDFLRQKGIPGNRYLDGNSRGDGQGSSNFVVFPGNEGLLSILERNGQPVKKPFVYPQDKALATAQINAAKPVSEGGLGLGLGNTPMERAKAMGFDTEAFHGSPNPNIKQFDPALAGKNTSNAFDNYIFSTAEPQAANGYALSWDSFKKTIAEDPKYQAAETAKNKIYAQIPDAFASGDKAAVKALQAKANEQGKVHQDYYDRFLNQEIPSDGSSVYPLSLQSDHFYPSNAEGKLWREVNQKSIDNSKHWGYDGVKIGNVRDNAGNYGGLSDVFATSNPSRLRSRFAAFDPARRNEADILGRADPELLKMLAAAGLLGTAGYSALQDK